MARLPGNRAASNKPPMDHTTSHPLPEVVGSFSYSWPTSKQEPRTEERIGDGEIGTDPASASQYSFDFRPLPQQTETMADADQVFLDGLLLPLQLASQQGQQDGGSGHNEPVLMMLTRSLSLDSSQRMVASAAASRRHRLPPPASGNSSPCSLRRGRTVADVFRTSRLRLPSFGRCGRQHKWMSFRFLVPLCEKIVRCIWRRKAMEEAMDASQRAEYGHAKVKLCDSGQDSAIRDAILHCKRSL